MDLRWQAPGGIDQHHITATRFAGSHGIKAQCSRVAACAADDFDHIAIGPYGQLLARCGAEGVCRSQQHALPSLAQVLGELADGGGFARTVYARHHDDGGRVLANHQRLLQGLQQVGNGVCQQGAHLHRFAGARRPDALAQIRQQEVGGLHARIGHEQGGFQLFVQRFVYLADAKCRADIAAGFFQPSFEPAQPVAAVGGGCGWGWFCVWFRGCL